MSDATLPDPPERLSMLKMAHFPELRLYPERPTCAQQGWRYP